MVGNIAGIASTLPMMASRAIYGEIPTEGLRGAVNAIPKATAAIDNFARGGKVAADASKLEKLGSLALRSGKGALVAAPMGALYGAGEADSGKRLEGAKQGALVAGGIGAALPIASAALGTVGSEINNITKGFGARGVEDLEDAGDAIRSASSQAYQKMRDTGAIFTPETSQNIVSELEKTLSNDGPLNSGLHGKTMPVLSDLKDKSENGGLSLEELDQWRQLFGDVASNFNDRGDARKSTLLIKKIDDIVDNVSPTDLQSGSESIS